MDDIITIRGKEYKAQAFSDLQLAPILKILSNITSLDLDLEQQFQVGFLLKEVIFEDLPQDIVKVTKNGNCILLLDIDELSQLAQDLSKLHTERGIKLSRERGDSERANKFEQKQKILNGENMSETDKQAILAKIEELKLQIK